MHISFDDPLEALEEAARLVQDGRWWFREDPLGRRHVYERQFVPGKDPTLRPAEIVDVLQSADRCEFERASSEFFRAEAAVQGPDWEGRGRVLFHIEPLPGSAPHRRVVIVTAFRICGWRARE